MPSTFFGLEIGSRALAANQTALDVIGHNTSNINTPGYSREVVNLQASSPYTILGAGPSSRGQIGTGVEVASITRIRDEFVDLQVFDANGRQGHLSDLNDVLSRVEQAYNEPGTAGIGSQITAFFNSFSDLSATPESQALRATVRNGAQALVAAFNSVSTALGQITPDITAKISVKVDQVNDIATQIASLNNQIRLSQASGDHPNDLEDKRGDLINQLSQIVQVQVTRPTDAATGAATGEININIGGYSLVQGNTTSSLPKTTTSANGSYGFITGSGITIPLAGGEIAGLLEGTARIAGYQQDLDTLASSVVTAVNAQHRAGVDLSGTAGQDFFTGTTAKNIALSGAIQSNLSAIAAAAAPTPPNLFATGNGDNARALSGLSQLPGVGTFTFNDYYNARVSQIGADAQSASTQLDNQGKVLNQLQATQSSVSGVSLDEELTKMLQYQKSYQAAARLVNVMDDMLDRIINGLGSTAATTGG